MKKVKIIIWVILLAIVGLVLFQNRAFILSQHTFQVDFWFYAYQSPPIPNLALLAGFFVAGLLLAYIGTLSGRFKSRKTIKDLNQQIRVYQEKNSALAQELSNLKNVPPPAAETAPPAASSASETTTGETTG